MDEKTSFGESMNVATPAQPHTRTVRSRMRGQKMEFFSPDNDRLVIIRSE
jgi:hypothetical protein